MRLLVLLDLMFFFFSLFLWWDVGIRNEYYGVSSSLDIIRLIITVSLRPLYHLALRRLVGKPRYGAWTGFENAIGLTLSTYVQ
jgi:hypothetical protein